MLRSNGTIVSPNDVASVTQLAKRWQDAYIEVLTFDDSHFRVGDAGFQAGFTDASSSAIL